MVKGYKGLIDALKACAPTYANETDLKYIGLDTLLNDAADAIENLRSAVPRWISAEERLPEDVDCYLCRIDCPNGKWLEVCKYTENQNFANFYNGEDATDFVTHWMPLPEPPEEE